MSEHHADRGDRLEGKQAKRSGRIDRLGYRQDKQEERVIALEQLVRITADRPTEERRAHDDRLDKERRFSRNERLSVIVAVAGAVAAVIVILVISFIEWNAPIQKRFRCKNESNLAKKRSK